jgi:hypothetical protein
MMFPFSFWGVDIWAGITQNLEQTEDFTGYFPAWAGVAQNLEQTEDFTNYWTAEWAGVAQNLELAEDFNTW